MNLNKETRFICYQRVFKEFGCVWVSSSQIYKYVVNAFFTIQFTVPFKQQKDDPEKTKIIF